MKIKAWIILLFGKIMQMAMPFHVSSPHSIQLYVTLFKLWYKKKCKNLFFFIRDNYYLSLDSLDMFVIYQLLVKSDMSVLSGIRVKVPQVEESTVKDTPSSSYGGLVCTVRWFTKCKPERKSRSAWWCQAFSPAHIGTHRLKICLKMWHRGSFCLILA